MVSVLSNRRGILQRSQHQLRLLGLYDWPLYPLAQVSLNIANGRKENEHIHRDKNNSVSLNRFTKEKQNWGKVTFKKTGNCIAHILRWTENVHSSSHNTELCFFFFLKKVLVFFSSGKNRTGRVRYFVCIFCLMFSKTGLFYFKKSWNRKRRNTC